MSLKIAFSKIGKNVLKLLSPNDAIFDSSQNTFKIIVEGQKTVELAASTNDQSFTVKHGLPFTPLVHAFAKRTNGARVFLPNSKDVILWTAKVGWMDNGFNNVQFNYVEANNTNVVFNFDNQDGSAVNIDIKYFCLEAI